MNKMITGRCECGDVQYEIDDEISDYSHCHCSQCRRLHGAAFATFAGVTRDKFRYTSGQSSVKKYNSSAGSVRVFCANCGSSILVEVDAEPDATYVAMGTMNGKPTCPRGYHQFVESMAPWYDITDDLPQYPGSIDEQPGPQV